MPSLRQILSSLFLLIIGILIGYLSTQFEFFTIKYELDIIASFFSAVTLIVGIYIAVVIQKNISDNRVQKNIFIERLTEIKETFNKIDEEINSQCKFITLNSLFKQTSSKLALIEKLLKHIKIRNCLTEIESLKELFVIYKQSATNVKVGEGKYLYTGENMSSLHVQRNDILAKIDIAILNINLS